MQNRICAKLDIKYPIIQGGMLGYSKSGLVSAVSNAGGLGLLAGAMGPKALRNEIHKTRELTDNPFGVNLPLVMERRSQASLDVALEEHVKIFVTAAGNPERFAKIIKDAGAVVMHVIPSVRHAIKAEASGVDIIIAAGTEGGGLVGPMGVTTFVLVPQVVDAVKLPVVAAGGIGDARGFVAALALGAEGIQMGTRFLATKECETDDTLKEAIIKATDTSTELLGDGARQGRAFAQDFLQSVLSASTSPIPEDADYQTLDALDSKAIEEDIRLKRMFPSGQVAGMIKEILTVEEVIKSLVQGVAEVSGRLENAL